VHESHRPITVNQGAGPSNTDKNRLLISQTQNEVKIRFELWNAAVRWLQPPVAIDGTIRIKHGSDPIEICYTGDSYPAMEAYHRYVLNGREVTKTIVREPAGNSLGLLPWSGQRNQCYVEGD